MASTANDGKSTWTGGERPMEASYGKLMMWYFLVSDAFTFGALLIVYATLRVTDFLVLKHLMESR